MSTPQDLLNDFLKAREAKDQTAMDSAQDRILELDPNIAENASARFRMALTVLHDDNDAQEAMDLLEAVVKSPLTTDDAEQARIMYAICLWGQGKHQLAIFTLRKILSGSSKPTIHTSLALDYLVLYMGEIDTPEKEINSINNMRIDQLSKLSHEAENVQDKAGYALRLASCLESRGSDEDLVHARRLYESIVNEGKKIEPLTLMAAKDCLKRLRQKK